MLGMTEVIKIAELFDKDPANLVTCSPSCHLWSSSPLTWETFNNCTIWGYWIDRKFPMNHIYPLSGILFLKFSRIGQYWAYYPSRFFFLRYPYLLECLPYALEVVTYLKKPEDSSETFVNHLFLYLLRNKIIKTK